MKDKPVTIEEKLDKLIDQQETTNMLLLFGVAILAGSSLGLITGGAIVRWFIG